MSQEFSCQLDQAQCLLEFLERHQVDMVASPLHETGVHMFFPVDNLPSPELDSSIAKLAPVLAMLLRLQGRIKRKRKPKILFISKRTR
jgi:hypothetical protein